MSCFENFIPTTALEHKIVNVHYASTRKRDIILSILKSDSFKQWYNQNYNKSLDENEDETNTYNALMKYYRKHYFNVSESSSVSGNKGRFTSYTARKSALDETVRRFQLLYFNGYTASGKDGKIHKYKSYEDMCDYVANSWEQFCTGLAAKIVQKNKDDNFIIELLAKYSNVNNRQQRQQLVAKLKQAIENKQNTKEIKQSIKELDKIIDDNTYHLFEELLSKNKLYSNDVTKNAFAIYAETKGWFEDDKYFRAAENPFFDAVKEYASIKHITNLSAKSKLKYNYEADEEENLLETVDGDNYIAKVNQHLGDFDSFSQHVDSIIRSYLSTLVNISDINNEESYEVDDEIGVPKVMNVGEVMAVLYSRTDKSSPENMIASIRRIAETDKSMKGIIKVANDMMRNQNFAMAMYSVFGKYVMPKTLISVTSDGVSCKISNIKSSRTSALRMLCLNEIRNTSLNFDPITISSRLNDLLKKSDGRIDKNILLSNLNTIVSFVIPSLSKGAIESYCYNGDNFFDRYKEIVVLTQNVVNKALDCQQNYNDILTRQKNIRDTIKKYNKALNTIRDDYARYHYAALYDRIKNGENAINNEQQKLYATYKEDFVSSIKASLFKLTDKLVDYTSVKIELNSINVEGNSSSDVINSSMITSIMNRLEKEAALVAMGESYARNSSTMYSNILIERKDEHGNIINPGLFEIKPPVEGNSSPSVKPTEYARDIINFSLFDGVINEETDESVLYSKMNDTDYITSMFESYFSNETTPDGKIKLANYFTRIPSDAPKTFICSAPKVDTKGLISASLDVNTQHNTFELFRNVFYSELNDAVQALGRIFVIKDGSVRKENGEPIFRPGYSNNPEDARKAYDVYHVGTDKKQNRFFYKKDDKGNCILAGKVFSSDRFILEGINKNFADDIIGKEVVDGKPNGVINFLYGGSEFGNGLNITVTEDEHGNVTKVSYSLTEEQKQQIDNMISDFIKGYISQSIEKIRNVETLKDATTDSIVDFAINTYLMYVNFNELLEGDTKFYKDSQTFLKRAKEMQGSGVPYGIVNWGDEYEPTFGHIDSGLDTANIEVNGNKVELKDGFRGVTILNTIRTSEDSIRLFGTAAKKFKDGSLVKNKIINADTAARLSDLYSGTKINDAQSYITFEEWIRRITARGQLPRYKPLIDRILDESKPLSAEDIQEFVQVQKNFYYDLHYDAEFDKFIPRQIKNAEFVLVPRFIKGTELEKVYNLMTDYKIDQLNTAETSKAGKKTVLSLFDDNGNITDETINDFTSHIDTAIESYSYNYLYTQQEVAQHMDKENKVSIQLMKKALDNIDENSPCWEYKQAIIDAYCKNIKSSAEELCEALGIELDEDGNPKIHYENGEPVLDKVNLEKLYSMFAEEAQRTNADSNTLGFFKLDKNGIPTLPAFLSNVSTKIESIVQSVFNNHVTRQILSGFHAAQVTGVGMSSKIISQDAFTTKSGKDTGNKLQFHPEVNGVIQPYSECLVCMPKQYLIKYNKLITEGKTKEEAEKDILTIMQTDKTDTIIAYRIPTEAKCSISVMKVVGFIDRAQGSTIVVADDWVSQTGSDFDVDSIYTITRSVIVDTEGNTIDPKRDSIEERGNIILDNIINILSNSTSFEENLTPSNFKDIINARDGYKELVNGEEIEHEGLIPKEIADTKKYRSCYNWYSQSEFQGDVISGVSLKGMSVQMDNLCSICNNIHPKIENPYCAIYYKSDGYTEKDIKGYGYYNKKSVTRNGQKDTMFIVTHNKYGWSDNNKNIKGRLITAYTAQTTAHILDAVKEGNIPNVNIFSFNIYKVFPSIGMDYDTAISFMTQPVVTELIKEYQRSNSCYSFNSESYYLVKDFVLGKYLLKIASSAVKGDKNKTYVDKKIFLKEYNQIKRDLIDAFDLDKSIDIDKLFSKEIQLQRINKTGPFENNEDLQAKYDIHTIMQFDDLYNFSNTLSDYVNCLTPDKFGAKVSTYKTKEVIKKIIKNRKNLALYVNKNGENISILESVYPDCKNYKNFVEAVYEQENGTDFKLFNEELSSYPIANYFLHYSTLFSLIVEKSIFDTEKLDFTNKIEKLFENDGVFPTEEKYNDYKKWYLATKIFRNTNFLIDDVEQNINQNDSIERITGQNISLKNNFYCEDIDNPTEEEKENFKALTPAQKVLFIQQHANDAGIFGKLNVNLFNNNQYTNMSATHRITFNSDLYDIEQALNEMKEAWHNNNWLVKQTVLDLFKYAIVSENFSRKRFGITQLIINDILIDTNFANNVVEELKNDEYNELDEINYVRGNYKKLNLSKPKKPWEYLDRKGNVFVLYYDTDRNNNVSYNFIGKDTLPKYIVNSVKGESTVYVIKYRDNFIYYIPLKQLLPFENSSISINDDYNQRPSVNYYLKYIDSVETNTNFNENISNYIEKNKTNHTIVELDIVAEAAKSETSGFRFLVNKIKDLSEYSSSFFVTNNALVKYLPSTNIGEQSVIVQQIEDKTYNITHVDSKYVGNVKVNDELKAAKKMYPKWLEKYGKVDNNESLKEFAENYVNYLEKNLNRPITDNLSDVIKSAIIQKAEFINNLFYVTEAPTEMESSVGELTVEDVASEYVKNIVNDSKNENEEAFKTLSALEDLGIDIKNKDSINENVPSILERTKRYLNKKSESLIKDANEFYKDPSGNYHRLDEDETIEYISNNKKEMLRWLKLYFDIKNLGNKYNSINTLGFNIDSESEENKQLLNQINNIVRNLTTQNFIKVAENKFAKLIMKNSGDELIANEWFDLTSTGFHNLSWFESWVTDAQEAPIPLMQVILHLVTSDVHAKELQMTKRIQEFTKETDDIYRNASNSGSPINMSKIVDDNGNLIQEYNDDFVKTFENYRNQLKELSLNKGRFSVEYLRKKHEYEAFLIDNVNREYVDQYYKEIWDAEGIMLDEEKGFPLLYAKYKELTSKRTDILSNNINGKLTDTQKKELEEVQKEIDGLTSDYEGYEFKPRIDEILGGVLKLRSEWTEQEEHDANFSYEAAQKLKYYLATRSKISEKYMNSSVKEGFDELLKKYLAVIYDCEKPDINGVPTVPATVLNTIEKYVEAKDWIKHNCRFVAEKELEERIHRALKDLNFVKAGTTGLLFKLAKQLDARDTAGVVDGRKFEAIDPTTGKSYAQLLKEDICNKMNISATEAYDDRKLICNGDNSPFVWSYDAFWSKLISDGYKNQDYIQLVNDINNILIKAYDSKAKRVETLLLSEEDLDKLAALYELIRPSRYSPENVKSGNFITRTEGSSNGTQIKDFIDKYCDVTPSEEQLAIFEEERSKAEMAYGKSSNMYASWLMANCFISSFENEDGSISSTFIPNPFLYGGIKPKFEDGKIVRDNNGVAIKVEGDANFMRFIDEKKTLAQDVLRQTTRREETAYYWTARREALTKKPGETDEDCKNRFNKWFTDNHYFNPITHSVEPIPCWVTTNYRDGIVSLAAKTGNSNLYHYEPRWTQQETEIKKGDYNATTKKKDPDYRNHDYKEDYGHVANYKSKDKRHHLITEGNPYDSNVNRTAYEQQLYDLFRNTMNDLCISSKAKRYIQRGALPAKAKEPNHSATWHMKQMANAIGYWYPTIKKGNDDADWQEIVDYDHDYQIDMPGLKQLVDNSKGGTEKKLFYPKKSDPEFNKYGVFDKNAYDKACEEIRKKNKEIEEHNKEIHKALLDRDWVKVIKEFMNNAAHYNAVQENKLLLYFGLDYLRNHKVYKTNLATGKIKRDKQKSLGNDVVYEQKGYGENTMKVYETFARRYIFNQFKKDQGFRTKLGNWLQQWSSAKYMMFNVTGGLANVAYGETQIAMEAFAKEYFNTAEWLKGKALWLASLPSFGANMYSDKASDLGDAMCKFMQTLEFDKITELHEDNPSAKTKYTRIRNAGYCLQTIGEHFMQNGALLTMLNSHRIYKAPNGKWVSTSKEKYIRNKRLEAIKEILGPNNEDFDNFIKTINKDISDVKDYAVRRKEPITEFVRHHLTESQQKEFIAKQKELEEKAAKEFEQLPTVYSQFELVNGYAEFKADSLLADRNKMTEEEAYNILGCMKNKTISVNKKIHGVYDKLGASRIEQEWFGGLVMQYHKHIWPGIMKRWRREGYYNEDRDTVEKGMYTSLFDFLSIPYKDFKDLPESSRDVMTGIQNFLGCATKFLFNIKHNYDLLPTYEKANIRRCISEMLSFCSAVCIAIALKVMNDDDEYKDNYLFNISVYLADRISTELEMYTPRGAMGEAKKLWSQPIAAESGINDLLQVINNVSQLLLQGDEYNPKYKSGPYYNQNKITTLLTRQLPIYRSLNQVWRLPKNNKYYKRQTTFASDMSDIILKYAD